MTETTVVNVRYSACDVRIDRRGPYGNRYIIGQHGNRQEVLAKHDREWRAMLECDFTRGQAVACLQYMKGKRLGCHCKPLACHGDTYLALIAEWCP